MVEAALMAEEAKPDLIDLNFGCPVKKIAARGAGQDANVPLMVEMTKAIVDAVKLPVTVKTDWAGMRTVKILLRLLRGCRMQV